MKTNNKTKARRKFSVETKLQILKEGRDTNPSISQVRDQYQISPTLFYQWERIAAPLFTRRMIRVRRTVSR